MLPKPHIHTYISQDLIKLYGNIDHLRDGILTLISQPNLMPLNNFWPLSFVTLTLSLPLKFSLAYTFTKKLSLFK